MLLQLIISGLVNGCVYALMALGMTSLYRSTTVVNFSHGALFMISAFIMVLGQHLAIANIWLLAALSMLVLFGLGCIINTVFMRALRNAPHLSVAMMTVALAFLLKGIMEYFFGTSFGSIPALVSGAPLEFAGIFLNRQGVVIIGASVVVLVGFGIVFKFTEIGKVIEASSESPRGASSMGFDVPRIQTVLWGVCAALAALAGVLTASRTLVYPDMGSHMLIQGLAAMTLGGFGSFTGAVVGGIVLGVAENLVGGFVSTNMVEVTSYIVILVVLVVRPQGLFGKTGYSRV